MAIPGTHIYTQTQIGPTRDQWAKMLGERRVVWITPGAGLGHPPVHEEMRAVVAPTDLTTKLGYRKDRKAPNGFSTRHWQLFKLYATEGDLELIEERLDVECMRVNAMEEGRCIEPS